MPTRGIKLWHFALALALTGIIALMVLLNHRPPQPLSIDTAATQFSAMRAKQDVAALTAFGPRPVGRDGKPHPESHRLARQWVERRLRELGLTPEVQTGNVCEGGHCSEVENVIARRPAEGRQTGIGQPRRLRIVGASDAELFDLGEQLAVAQQGDLGRGAVVERVGQQACGGLLGGVLFALRAGPCRLGAGLRGDDLGDAVERRPGIDRGAAGDEQKAEGGESGAGHGVPCSFSTGTSAIPHLGQAPGSEERTSGCIGQV